ncbi:MAG: glycosyltransferase family 2 protein [Candidatus Omnitrophota bacterium]
MYRDRRISLVIPARNEERLIRPTLEHIPDIIDKIYVIDDASTDLTAAIVEEFGKNDPRVNLIRLEKNMGPGGAIIRGYAESSRKGYDISIVIGGDNQMSLDIISSFLDPIIDNECGYTKGNRFLSGFAIFYSMPPARLIGNCIFSLLTMVASGYYRIFDFVNGYTAITKQAIDTINWKNAWTQYGYPIDFLIRLNAYGFKVKDIPARAIYLKKEKQSQMKKCRYIVSVVPMLFRGFFWRLAKKYLYSSLS